MLFFGHLLLSNYDRPLLNDLCCEVYFNKKPGTELTGLPFGPSSPGGPLGPGGPAAPAGPASPFSPRSPLEPYNNMQHVTSAITCKARIQSC